MTQEEKYKLTQKLMDDIGSLLKEYMRTLDVRGVPIMKIRPSSDFATTMTVNDMIDAVDATLVNNPRYADGLRAKCRDRYLVMRRQIICYMSRKLGSSTVHIANSMGIDHATIIHGSRLVENLLKVNDAQMTITYNEVLEIINNYSKRKYGKDLPDIIERRTYA